MSPSARSPGLLLTLLAFGSGCAALIYEIVWFRQLGLSVGSGAVSLAVILATFMGGTGLGSFLFPRWVRARRNPLVVCAAIEAGIGVFGLLGLVLIPLVGRAYLSWAGYGLDGFLVRGAVGAACLLPPTLLIGATLPALARLIPHGTDGVTPIGVSWLGLIYGANIAGAVAGCLLAGFYLLRVHDIVTATLAAVAINVMVAGLALLWGWLAGGRPPEPVGAETDGNVSFRAVYIVIGLSGFSAIAAEAVWTRTLGLLFGASVYTLSVVLAVFLAGLGIGSGIGAWLARSQAHARAALGGCQLLLAGAIAWTASTIVESLPYWPIDPSLATHVAFNFQTDLVRALWALLPPTLLWGASFPLALAAARSGTRDPGRLVARVYAANTAGGVGGALAATLLLVPALGSGGAQQVLVGLSTAGGLLLLASRTKRSLSLAAGAVFATLLLMASVPPMSGLLIAHGRFAVSWVGKSDIVYAEEGRDASVAVSEFSNGVRTFHVAGKIQASSAPRDMRLQRMLGHLTTLTAFRPRSVLVIGNGAGVTAGAVTVDPSVEAVTIVEIEPLVTKAAGYWFASENLHALDSPKVEVTIDDGRHFLLTTPDRFDAVTVDPLDPWVRGAANLYTLEFLEAARERLNPGGVMTMYIQLFETTREAVASAVATFMEVFPTATVWGNTYQGQGYDLVLLGSVEPLHVDLDELAERLGRPEYAPVARSLDEIGFQMPVDLFATFGGGGNDLARWTEGAPINRDRNLRLEYLAGLGLNADESAAIYFGLLGFRRFPEGMFTGSEAEINRLREALGDHGGF